MIFRHRAATAVARASLAAVVLVSGFVSSPAPAHAATASNFVFAGRGYGHGVGLSQYGARAQALAGRSAETIVRSYYDGVSFSVRGAQNIRVLLESDNDVVVTAVEPFTARIGSTILATSSDAEPFMRALAASDGTRLYRSSSRTGPWTHVTTASTSQRIRYVPGGSHLRLVYDGGARRTFRRYIDVVRTSSTRVHAVNQLYLEEYLYGVVPWEMPSSWPSEALQAQAIVARSYALNQKIRRRAQGSWYDICDTTSCQVYGGYSAENVNSNAAVDATEGKVATHPDSGTTASGVILAVFSSSTGGATENNTDGFGSSVQYPYLRSAPDPWSLDPEARNPYASWETSVSAASVAADVGLDSVSAVTVTARNPSGSARTLSFTGVRDGVRTTVTRSGLWTRSAFGLRSIHILRVFTPPFFDDDGSAHEANIVAIWREGITGGCRPDRFCPSQHTTRGQMATLLSHALDLPPATTDHFADDDGSTHEAGINRLATAGITDGCDADARLYCPNEPVTRAQMATFIARAFTLPAASGTNHFTDDDGSMHEANINRLADADITGGCVASRYCPGDLVTRAQMATFLARALNLP